MEALKKKDQNSETDKATESKSKPKRGPLKLFTVKLRGLTYNHKKKDIKQFFRPLKIDQIGTRASENQGDSLRWF